MMKSLIILILLPSVCTASPVATSEKDEKAAIYAYAADVSDYLSVVNFKCLRESGYSTVFVQVYAGTFTSGQVDPNGVNNIVNAAAANLGVEIYVTPSTDSRITGADQFDITYNYLRQNGISVKAIWLKVTHPIVWRDTQFNIDLITSFITRAKQYNLRVGIYTNWYDWQEIAEDWNGGTLLGPISLWYWNANGVGTNAASAPDFADFRPFGGFNTATVKLYSFNTLICTVRVHQLIYPANAAILASALQQTPQKMPLPMEGEKPAKIIVGALKL